MKYSFFPPPLRWNILILIFCVYFWAPCVLWYSSNTFFFNLVASLCCCCSLARSCLILCDPMDGSMPGSSVLHYLLEFAQIRIHWVTMCVKVAQSYLTLCDPMDYTVHGTVQARILEWVALPSPGDLPNPGIKPQFPALQMDSFFFFLLASWVYCKS